MTGNDILNTIASMTEASVFTLGPGPVRLNVAYTDAMAGRLLIWLKGQMRPDATQGELDDILSCAQWWSTLLASLVIEGQ